MFGIQKSANSESDSLLSIRFTVPIIIENTATIFIGLVLSGIYSGISASAMAAIGMANTVVTVVSSFFAIVSGSTAVIVSRHIGAGEGREAGEVVSQSITLSALLSLGMTALTVALSTPLFKLLIPTAEASLFNEAVNYFRIMMLSLPGLVLISVLSPIFRAMGSSHVSFTATIITSVSQLLFSWVFIQKFQMNEIGAGLAAVLCRVIGTACLLFALLRDHRFFTIHIKDILRLHRSTCKRIFRLGVPISLESIIVQLGYMLANSMVISLGTFESGVYQIINTIGSFTGLAQGICSAIGSAVIGQLLGAGRPDRARKLGRGIWAAGLLSTAMLCSLVLLLGRPLSGLYSSDPATITESARLLWVLLMMNMAGVSINAIDPQLKAGGDVNFVMIMTVSAVWLIRLPLTWLFCFKLNMGVVGIYLGNSISLYFRAILGFIRHCGKKWYVKKI
ncbi:MAG: MATE family efflux transporter [Clostridia bacterium]|nr:MATE family efflux transporter [Clostridia bacterium]